MEGKEIHYHNTQRTAALFDVSLKFHSSCSLIKIPGSAESRWGEKVTMEILHLHSNATALQSRLHNSLCPKLRNRTKSVLTTFFSPFSWFFFRAYVWPSRWLSFAFTRWCVRRFIHKFLASLVKQTTTAHEFQASTGWDVRRKTIYRCSISLQVHMEVAENDCRHQPDHRKLIEGTQFTRRVKVRGT